MQLHLLSSGAILAVLSFATAQTSTTAPTSTLDISTDTVPGIIRISTNGSTFSSTVFPSTTGSVDLSTLPGIIRISTNGSTLSSTVFPTTTATKGNGSVSHGGSSLKPTSTGRTGGGSVNGTNGGGRVVGGGEGLGRFVVLMGVLGVGVGLLV